MFKKELLSIALVCGTFSAAAVVPSEASRRLDERPYAKYAKYYGVSESEARRRAVLIADVGVIQGEIAKEFPDTFGGLYIQNVPDFKIVVQFTRDAERSLRAVTNNQSYVSALSPESFSTLRATQDVLGEEMHAKGIEFMSGINLASSSIDVYVRKLESARDTISVFRDASSYIKVHEVEGFVDPTALITRTFFAGTSISGLEVGGSKCTSGFNVKSSDGTVGLTTAGHCQNNLTHKSSSSSAAEALDYKGEKNVGSADIQWHTRPDGRYRWEPSYDVAAGSQTRTISFVKGALSLAVGMWVCKYGRTTYETCGEIQDLNSQSLWNGQVGTYIRATDLVDNRTMTDEGDSGGPVYGYGSSDGRLNAAYGMVHGRGSPGTAYDKDLFFMSADQFAGFGLQILTTENSP